MIPHNVIALMKILGCTGVQGSNDGIVHGTYLSLTVQVCLCELVIYFDHS